MTLVRSRTTVATEVDAWSVRSRTLAATSIVGTVIRSRTLAATQVLGPPVRSRTLVALSVVQVKVRSRTVAKSQVYGGPVRGHVNLQTSVNAYTGTGLRRGRLRDPDALQVGTGVFGFHRAPPPPPLVPVPVASFTSSAAGLTVTFTDTTTNSPAAWLWDFGDGRTSTAQNPVETFPANGLYSVTLTATNAGGDSIPTTQAISVAAIVPPPPPGGTSFLGNAFWTTPLSPTAVLASTSSNSVARLTYQATMTKTTSPVYGGYNSPANTITNGSNTPPPFGSSFALPIYRAPAGTTRIPVYAARQKAGLQTVLDAGVPLPDPNMIPGGTIPPSGSDGSVIVLDSSTGELWEMWQLATTSDYLTKTDPNAVIPPGYDWVCTQAGKMTNRNTHPGIWKAPPSWGVGAAGISKAGGMLTADDFYGDTIGHPLGLSLPITGGDQTTTPIETSKILPATRYDRMSLIPGGVTAQPAAEHIRVAEGSRFRLLPASWSDSAINTYATAHGQSAADRFGTTAPLLVKVLRALRDYGMIVTDTAGVVAFSAENPKTFGTPYNPYTLEQTPVWGNFGQQIPWASLVQVAAPTVDISVVGA